MDERAPFRFRRATSLAGRRPYNAFGAKIDLGLRYLANGDENWHHCAFGAGALVSIGEGLPAPAAPLWIRPWFKNYKLPLYVFFLSKMVTEMTGTLWWSV